MGKKILQIFLHFDETVYVCECFGERGISEKAKKGAEARKLASCR